MTPFVVQDAYGATTCRELQVSTRHARALSPVPFVATTAELSQTAKWHACKPIGLVGALDPRSVLNCASLVGLRACPIYRLGDNRNCDFGARRPRTKCSLR